MAEDIHPEKIFKVLAIDGGGIKGLYSATILAHFEEQFQCLISDHFDMFCGTSTGGLIALAASLKISMKRVCDFYAQEGQNIFPTFSKIWLPFIKRTFTKGDYKQILKGGKFSDVPLKKALQNIFQDKIIGQSNNLLCIPSYTITEGRPWVFKFDHPEGKLSRDNKTMYVDVALATSAAPTFFPLVDIPAYNNKQFIDGGVWANNHAMTGMLEALDYFVGSGKQFDQLHLLSVSSLTNTGGKNIGLKRNRAFIDWREDLFDTCLTGQSLFAHYFLEKITRLTEVTIKYVRIPSASISKEQEENIKLDVATKKAIDLIAGKGNDMGLIYRKDPEIASFFKFPKTYQTQGK